MVQQDAPAPKNSTKARTAEKGNDEQPVKRSTRNNNSVNEEHVTDATKNSTAVAESRASTRAKNSSKSTDVTTKKRKRDDSSPEQDRSVKRSKHVTAMEIDETINSTNQATTAPNKDIQQPNASKINAKNSADESTNKEISPTAASADNEFPLPNKYKVLSDVYKYVDTVFMYFKGKKNSILFEELQRQVEQMTRKPVSLLHLRQIQVRSTCSTHVTLTLH